MSLREPRTRRRPGAKIAHVGVRLATRIFLLAALVAWLLLLRPQAAGGPAGYVLVAGTSMQPNIQPGDLAVVLAHTQYAHGDVIAYRIPAGDPGAGRLVIHRIVGGSAHEGYIVAGDNAPGPDLWRPHQHDVVGGLWLVVPKVGIALESARQPVLIALTGATLASLFIWRLLNPPASRALQRRLAASGPHGSVTRSRSAGSYSRGAGPQSIRGRGWRGAGI